jgi:hypothetical protein
LLLLRIEFRQTYYPTVPTRRRSRSWPHARTGFCATVDGVEHSIVEQFESNDATIAESDVTYTRKDGDKVTVPVVTIYRSADELIDDYRVFIDLAPLFA